jgi:sirohydrochlorin cobalto/nickelchelatase
MSRKGLLLIGHGSKMPYNKELVDLTSTLIASQYPGEYVVKSAFMNMNSPSVPETLDAFRKEDIDALVVVPLFLAKGVHITKDIPPLVGLEEGQSKGTFTMNGKSIPLIYADPIGPDPLLADLMVKNAKRALSSLS